MHNVNLNSDNTIKFRTKIDDDIVIAIENWSLDYHLGNAIQCIVMSQKKGRDEEIADLKRARWYLDRKINRLER